MKRNVYSWILTAIVLLGAVGYAGWYSYERHEKIGEAQKCNDTLTNPPKPTMVTGPDGNPAPLYSLNGCVTIVVPPSLWDVLRGNIVFGNVPQRMKINPYSFTDILLGRYTFGPADVGCDQSATTTDCATIGSQNPPSPPPTYATADQVIIADQNPATSAPAGFHAMKDVQLNITFNAPVDWKPQYLPEGDGHASIVSSDFSNPLATMTGAYLHYYFQSPPDQFIGKPDEYLALLKQGSSWTEISLDSHVAYLAKPAQGYTMVVSEFSDDSFLTIAFDDTTGKYGTVLDEFLRSFHAQ